MEIGKLKIHVFKEQSYIPIENVKITIIQRKERAYRQIVQTAVTDLSGTTNEIELEAPPLEYSMNPSSYELPYGLCEVIVESPNYKKLIIKNCQIYPQITSIQNCYLKPRDTNETDVDIITVSDHTMVGDYPSKIRESETPEAVKPQGTFLVEPIKQIVIPDAIKIHDGRPDRWANKYIINYKDYIKNVVASEIYGTWHVEAIKANAIAIISFTLNRIYTEWYTGKAKKFNITTSTSFDQKWTLGMNWSDRINKVVDENFGVHIRKIGYDFPILAQYKNSNPPKGQLGQMESQKLAEQGMKAEEILKFFYGFEIQLSEIKDIGKLEESYPGHQLQLGDREESVKYLQKYLNKISDHYPSIPKLINDEIFGKKTEEAVKTFQGIFNMSKSGVVDYATWYKISDIYVGVTNKDFGQRHSARKTFIPPLFYRDSYDYPTFNYLDDINKDSVK